MSLIFYKDNGTEEHIAGLNGQADLVSGKGIVVQNGEVSQTRDQLTFTGTRNEWNSLSAEQKLQYGIANITDDVASGIPIIVDAVTNGDMNPVTSNAVFDALSQVGGGHQLPIVDLGTSYSAELKQDISSGAFKKAVVGGKLTINGHEYIMAHPDYWLHTGDTECTTHHMLVIPVGNIGTGKMNSSNTTTGGYLGSDLKTGNNSNTALATAKAQIIADFGAANILTHRELFTNAVTDGKASSMVWADSDVDLMNEVMVYGCAANASNPGYEMGIDKCQLKLFQERPDLISIRESWHLRSVVNVSNFAFVYLYGSAGDQGASGSAGVRPVFAIC